MAAGPPTIDATKKSAKYLGKKASDAAYKTSETAKKAGKYAADKTKKSAKYLAKKTGNAAYKTAKVAKKAGKAAWRGTKKAAEWGTDKTKESWDCWKDKTKKTVKTIGGKATAWHFEERDAKNTNLPSYEEVDNREGWRLCLPGESKWHQNGDKYPELKYINKDGREVVYDGYTKEIVTDPKYKGTYNYVVISQPPKKRSDVLGTCKYYSTGIAHVVVDVVPWAIGGNIRGKE
ncbi:hypothetical protein KAR34_08885 [bacterium]|nr:hypothetical protein [bacterium]